MPTICFECRFMVKDGWWWLFERGYYCTIVPPWVVNFVTGYKARMSCYKKNKLGECPDFQPKFTWKERIEKFEDRLMGKTE